MVASKLSQLAREDGARVGEEDLRLRVATGVEQNLPRLRDARGIFEAYPEIVLTQGDPAGLTAPADVDDLLAVGQQPLERLAGPGRLFPLPPRQELVRSGRYLYVAHLISHSLLGSSSVDPNVPRPR